MHLTLLLVTLSTTLLTLLLEYLIMTSMTAYFVQHVMRGDCFPMINTYNTYSCIHKSTIYTTS